ncbi:unnamed protein product [Phaedon cochleariae]|uniref:ATPase AAA-type core domain-containing protein n=1 Tax=Phaedon cochleariae TaxID=80249 RepID=A0A9P0DSX4_PHACE|nr:unnamed protein product [Phaedon cochleariae]
MSFEYYTNWWIASKKQLENLWIRDEIFRKKAKPINDRCLANMLIGGMYAKYSMLVQDIDACLDQMAQPQKRTTVRKLMDAATIRLTEMSNELKKIDLSEFHYIDGSLIELKLVPYDVEILHPALFFPRPIEVEEMWQKIQKGERIFSIPIPEEETAVPIEEENKEEVEAVPIPIDVKKSKEKKDRRPKPVIVEEAPKLSEEDEKELKRKQIITEAVKLIQIAERARQERLYFHIKNLIHHRKKTAIAAAQVHGNKALQAAENTEDLTAPLIKIQSLWRGFSARELMKAKEIERRLLIGMYEPPWKSKIEKETFERNLEKRREYRDQRIKEYIDSIDKEKARILRVVAPGLMEDIGDEIREWFHVWYREAKLFDKYPPEEKGGTILVVRGETMTPKEYLDEYERKRKEKMKAGGADKLKEKEKKEKLKKQEEERKKKEAEKKKKEAAAKAKKKKKKGGEYEFEYIETAGKPVYEKGIEEHQNIWDQRNEIENPLEKHYMDMITEQKCYEVQLEVRYKIDELMRLELEMLEEALEEDKIRLKGKKGKPKKKKKKPKKKRGKKGKKDPTANRTTEDLFQELFDNGIIRTYPHVRLDEYKGDFSYKNWDLRNQDFDPPATLLDVRQAIVMNCIMPMGVETMKRPKSVLIVGPRQSGKHLLANAIFNETHSVLFDLSPAITAGKYPGPKGMKMFLHLISKMSRLLAPSIIYFDGAEKIFYKKVPKEEKEMDPKRIGKKLVKGIIKTITPADRVLVLGISGKPWTGQAGKMKKAFEKNILIPRPDYNSIYLYWQDLLMSYNGIDRNFNITALTKVTTNYPLPVLKTVLEEIMTTRRIIQLRYNPLTVQEIYERFISQGLEPITDKEYKKFLQWYKKTPLGREKAAFNKWADAKREAEAKQKEKATKKK